MEVIEYWGDQHGLRLSMAQVPTQHAVKNIEAVSPITHTEQTYRFESNEQYLAWTYASRAQRRAASKGVNPSSLELCAWVINPKLPDDKFSNLHSCFESMNPHTRDRFVIQYMCPPQDLSTMPMYFTQTHRPPKDGKLIKNANYHGKLFLDDLFEAYTKGIDAVNTLMANSGHEYTHSKGFTLDPMDRPLRYTSLELQDESGHKVNMRREKHSIDIQLETPEGPRRFHPAINNLTEQRNVANQLSEFHKD